MKIYVASSWRNKYQPDVVARLRAEGHDVYDFRHPAPSNEGFAWSQIDAGWKDWTPALFRTALEHPIAQAGFASDMDALEACDVCLLVMPCGRSAHLELGWAAGAGKLTLVLIPDGEAMEPELMYLATGGIVIGIEEAVDVLRAVPGHCRICGCTDDDCMGCIEKTGAPCTWVDDEHTLCSACEEEQAA